MDRFNAVVDWCMGTAAGLTITGCVGIGVIAVIGVVFDPPQTPDPLNYVKEASLVCVEACVSTAGDELAQTCYKECMEWRLR
jgi:hypothetical protein